METDVQTKRWLSKGENKQVRMPECLHLCVLYCLTAAQQHITLETLVAFSH